MAENKKSVLLYCDLIHTVEKLDNETAGELFKHYLRYINDLNPKTEKVLVDVVFEPIKQNLKRDLKKWEEKIDKRSDAGKKSAAKKQFDKWLLENPDVSYISKDDHLFEAGRCIKYRNESFKDGYTVDWFYYDYCIEFHQQMATNSTSVESVKQEETNSTVKDNVTVIDKVIVKDINNTKKVKTFSEDVLNCYNNCLVYFPSHLKPKTEKQKNTWIDTVKKLNEIEKIPFELICKIVNKTRNDDFWSKNFLSLPKLRKKNKDDIMYIVFFNEKFETVKSTENKLELLKKNASGWGAKI